MIIDLHIMAAHILKIIRIFRGKRKLNKITTIPNQNINAENTNVITINSTKENLKYNSRFSIYWSMSSLLLENEKIKLRKARINRISDHSYSSITIEPPSKQKVCIPEYFNKSSELTLEYPTPEICIYLLNDVKIFGETNIILSNDQSILLNNLFFTSNKRADLKYGFLAGTINQNAYYANTIEEDIIDRGIYLINPANYNYYHFIYETLSRLVVVDHDVSFKKWPLLIDECIQKYDNILFLLEYLKNEHDIIWIKKNKKYRIEELVYPETLSWMPGNIHYGTTVLPVDYMISKKILLDLKKRLTLSADSVLSKKIYISRKNISTSRLNNEKEIEQIFSEVGFKIIFPETMSIKEQATIFHNADYIAGVSGGALANIVFCHPGSTLICIFPEKLHFYLYSTIAYNLGIKNIFLDAYITNKTPYVSTASFTLNTDYLKDFLKSIATDNK